MNAPVSFDPVEDAYSIPLDKIDVSNPKLYQDDIWYPYFERLRREDPVHYTKDGMYGSYWSVTKYKDIMQVETHHQLYSSEARLGGISITDRPAEFRRRSFISSDPPYHDEQRKVVSPVVAPMNLQLLSSTIRERAGRVLDGLPRNETFDWVQRVSIELTTMMLATLFDFPFEERRKLTFWSDVSTMDVNAGGVVDSEEKRLELLTECLEVMTKLFYERQKRDPAPDLLSMLAHGEATNRMTLRQRMGILILFLVGGNDTTRNSMSGGLLGLSRFPDQFQKLRENPELIPSAVSEIVRWQTPVIHMRRTALEDAEIGGKPIKAGDKVVIWYISGNRDEDVIERADEVIVDRKRPREHMSFGFGIHRCLGNRLAELQLRILWEEVLRRDLQIEVVDKPVYAYSNFLHAIRSLPVRIAA